MSDWKIYIEGRNTKTLKSCYNAGVDWGDGRGDGRGNGNGRGNGRGGGRGGDTGDGQEYHYSSSEVMGSGFGVGIEYDYLLTGDGKSQIVWEG